MKTTARFIAIIICSLCLYACGGPSIAYKKNVNSLLVVENFNTAEKKIQKNRGKYGKNAILLYYLDLALVQQHAQKYYDSDRNFTKAQSIAEDLINTSITEGVSSLLLNDYTIPYQGEDYEIALTFYFRAMNFLMRNDLEEALVEARKAVFYLDYVREHSKDNFDEPFVQYFSSLLFEDEGNLDSARIARQNAKNAYSRQKYPKNLTKTNVPENIDELGEVIFFHYNGLSAMKMSKSSQILWINAVPIAVNQGKLDTKTDAYNRALVSGLYPKSIVISLPFYKSVPYKIKKSELVVDEKIYPTKQVDNISKTAISEFEKKESAIFAKTITRIVLKYVMAVQAEKIIEASTGDETWGDIAKISTLMLGAATERADTRHWSTLPAEIRQSNVFLESGKHDIKVLFKDANNNIIKEHTFKNVRVKKGHRTYLHHRTAK